MLGSCHYSLRGALSSQGSSEEANTAQMARRSIDIPRCQRGCCHSYDSEKLEVVPSKSEHGQGSWVCRVCATPGDPEIKFIWEDFETTNRISSS